MHTHQGQVVRRRRHHYRLGHTVRPQDIVNELAHLTAALTHQRHHNHIGLGMPGHHSQQGALADPAAGKQAQSLALAQREQRIDRPHPHIQWFGYGAALQGVQRRPAQGHMMAATQGATAIDGLAGTVYYPAQKLLIDSHHTPGF